jgi:hypothetical protein
MVLRGDVAEALDLRAPGDPRRCEVADRHGDAVGSGLRSQLFDHGRRQLDAMDRNAAVGQR